MFVPSGALLVTVLEKETSTSPPVYGISFAPNLPLGGGGALSVCKCYGNEKLRFVLLDLGVTEEQVSTLMSDLQISGGAEISLNVTQEKLDRYGLGSLGYANTFLRHLESI